MTTNFDFLKKVDTDLYEIIEQAEHLYRDEYFDQCMAQTRRFGENVCKNVLGSHRTTEDTFDEMLATLKDKGSGEEQEKEFIDDLYFLKKYGNDAVHSSKVQKSGMDALECLKRAFEIAISYSVYNKGAKDSILKLRFDTELLVTGNKSKANLAEKYEETKKKQKASAKTSAVKNTASKKGRKSKKSVNLFPVMWSFKPKEDKKSSKGKSKKSFTQQSYVMTPEKSKKGRINFWILVGVTSFISLITILVLFVASVL